MTANLQALANTSSPVVFLAVLFGLSDCSKPSPACSSDPYQDAGRGCSMTPPRLRYFQNCFYDWLRMSRTQIARVRAVFPPAEHSLCTTGMTSILFSVRSFCL